MTNSEPPPTYTQEDESTLLERSAFSLQPQILIVPTTSPLGFQKGYLGADGEHAAIEGELQVKGATAGRWGRVTMSLRTTETAPDVEIELGSEEVVLFSALSSQETAGPSPSVYPFSIPLPSDTPQCLHTPRSAILHTLTATLHPIDAAAPKVSTSIVVHTRRYTPHPRVLHVAPETRTIAEPTSVQVQLPRTSFTAGEAIPLYVTVPTPRRELVVNEGIRLRNIRAELVRVVKIKQPDTDIPNAKDAVEDKGDTQGESSAAPAAPQKTGNLSSSHSLDLRSIVGVPGGGEVVALSGASCRLHPTRPLQIRLVLHPPHEDFPNVHDNAVEHPPTSELGHPESSTSCASISQETVIHSVSFVVCVHATFMHMQNHTERISSVSIPIMITPPTAPLPEVEESMDAAYHKKHDQPPTRTLRERRSTSV
ncbi:hypothetical protein NM688_g7864 [Phlebia brevispora]|uniref:Uncharacterized protein n=1 Tax=Phlebia brevispora TaxID=194682 RepID=A0ACC1S088_9APHY|nr:hypothetical protein NM688_g7864 [Phlebia brevispora]